MSSARVWDVDSGQCINVLQGQSGELLTAEFHPHGTRIATGGRDRMVWLWDVKSGREVARFQGHMNYVFSVAFSPDGATLSSGSGDGTVRLWQTKVPSSQRQRTLKAK